MGREISGALTGALVRYVRRVGGREALDNVLGRAREGRDIEELEDPDSWSSHAAVIALFDAAAAVLGDPDVGRHVGEDAAPTGVTSETTAVLRSLGSPAEVLRAIAATSAKFATILHMEALEVDDSHGVVTSVTVPPHVRYRHFCGYTAGVLAKAPALFGMDLGRVEEQECQTEGDPRCRFHVEWDPSTAPEHDVERENAYLRDQLEALTLRFEALQATACDLVSADGMDAALDAITRRARRAVRAPHFVLAVRLAGGDLKIHHEGLTDEEAAKLADEILAEEPDACDGSRLVVDVASGQEFFGRLAAIHGDGHRFFPEEHRLLAAYAANAAAALTTAAALEDVRRREATSGALLGLARELAVVASAGEVAERLADAIPAVVDCDAATVLLWDDAEARLVPTSSWRRGGEVLRGRDNAAFGTECPLVVELRAARHPVVVDGMAVEGKLRDVLGPDATTVAIVPIIAKAQLRGAIAVGVRRARPLGDDAETMARLIGMADYAATALDNAHLVERMRHQALHDALTGTPNQRLLRDRVEAAIAQAKRSPEHLALLFLDLDRFKVVNDTLGHAFGDQLLQQVAGRLAAVVRESDTVARLGGDEFAVLLPRLDTPKGAETAAQKILDALGEPFTVGGHRFYVTGSLGVAVYPDQGTDYQELTKNADAAMYRAKARGRGRYHLYDAQTAVTRDHTQLALEADLHGAVQRGEMRVMYQPQVDLHRLQVVAAEALVRWEHPALGMVPPDQFIPLAEETGLIVEIDAWVLRTACQQLAAWERAGMHGLRVAVNLSGADLRDPTLISRVAAAVTDAGIAPGQLELEVTERVVEQNAELFPVLDALRGVGVRLAIDDFGTGNSAFSRLHRGRIDILKIDKGFIAEIVGAEDEAPLVAAMISLGHTLGLEVVAEGVETEGQGAYLRERGCELMQGYAFSRPVAAEDFAALLQPLPRAEALQ